MGRYHRRKSKIVGPYCVRTRREHVPTKQNVNVGEARATLKQTTAGAPWPLPSIPICQKQKKNGIGSIFVDKEARLPHNHRLPAASGKIGAVGKIGVHHARHQEDVKKELFPSPQIGRPVHSRSRM